MLPINVRGFSRPYGFLFAEGDPAAEFPVGTFRGKGIAGAFRLPSPVASPGPRSDEGGEARYWLRDASRTVHGFLSESSRISLETLSKTHTDFDNFANGKPKRKRNFYGFSTFFFAFKKRNRTMD